MNTKEYSRITLNCILKEYDRRVQTELICLHIGTNRGSHLLTLVPRSRNFIPWRWRRCSSETSVYIISTRRHIPEDGILHSHRRDNLKPSWLWTFGFHQMLGVSWLDEKLLAFMKKFCFVKLVIHSFKLTTITTHKRRCNLMRQVYRSLETNELCRHATTSHASQSWSNVKRT
jgi:hypothetical protein